MQVKKLMTVKGAAFLIIFTLLVFLGKQVNFSTLIGDENQFFTLFQFFGPIAGAFLGPVVGVLAVLIAELGSYLAGSSFTLLGLLRLLPMLFAAWYFGAKRDKVGLIVPIFAIALFVAHPVGRQVWFFSMYWTIPVIVRFLPKKYGESLFLRSLGATFTAHAVGGAIWIYSVTMTAEQWVGLIPVVMYERLLFASGIAVSYLVFNTVLDRVVVKDKHEYVQVDKRRVLVKSVA